MERPFVLWLAEMEAIDLSIFQHLHEGWIDRFGSLVVSRFKLATSPPCVARTWCGNTSNSAPSILDGFHSDRVSCAL